MEVGFVSNLLPIINLKAINQFIHTEHFKMGGIYTVRDLLRPGDWLAKVDLKKCIFCNTNLHTTQKLPNTLVSGEDIPFHVSTIHPVDLYKDTETCSGPTMQDGYEASSLHQ